MAAHIHTRAYVYLVGLTKGSSNLLRPCVVLQGSYLAPVKLSICVKLFVLLGGCTILNLLEYVQYLKGSVVHVFR